MTDTPDTMRHWNALGKTDPAHTKPFKRGGGFSGTAMKPIWIIKQLTQQFGPIGEGWGVNKPEFQVVDLSRDTGKVLVYCWVECWHTERSNTFYGVGGDSVQDSFRSGPFADDEAFKKAFTDAVNNAFKFVGVGADIHMGQFDDSKYVQEVAAEFKPTPPCVEDLKLFEEKVAATTVVDDLKALLADYRDTIAEASQHDAAAVAKAKQKFAAKKKALESA